jgi:hypothetical protein
MKNLPCFHNFETFDLSLFGETDDARLISLLNLDDLSSYLPELEALGLFFENKKAIQSLQG